MEKKSEQLELFNDIPTPTCERCDKKVTDGLVRSPTGEMVCKECLAHEEEEDPGCPNCESTEYDHLLEETTDQNWKPTKTGKIGCTECMKECSGCGKIVRENDEMPMAPDGEPYCSECYSEYWRTCDKCGDVEPSSEMNWVEGEEVEICNTCYNYHYFGCDKCSHIYSNGEKNTGKNGDLLCNNCWVKYPKEHPDNENEDEENEDEEDEDSTANKILTINPKAWTKLLLSIGYTGINDPGFGILHPNEPAQGCALYNGALEVLDIIRNPVSLVKKKININEKLPNKNKERVIKHLLDSGRDFDITKIDPNNLSTDTFIKLLNLILKHAKENQNKSGDRIFLDKLKDKRKITDTLDFLLFNLESPQDVMNYFDNMIDVFEKLGPERSMKYLEVPEFKNSVLRILPLEFRANWYLNNESIPSLELNNKEINELGDLIYSKKTVNEQILNTLSGSSLINFFHSTKYIKELAQNSQIVLKFLDYTRDWDRMLFLKKLDIKTLETLKETSKSQSITPGIENVIAELIQEKNDTIQKLLQINPKHWSNKIYNIVQNEPIIFHKLYSILSSKDKINIIRNIDPAELVNLLNEPDKLVRAEIAKVVDPDKLTPLASDPSAYIRGIVAKRLPIGDKLIQQLSKDKNPQVRQIALKRLANLNANLTKLADIGGVKTEIDISRNDDIWGTLEKYVDLPLHYVRFTDHPKLIGLNPKTTFSTPIGIYGYPLTRERIEKIKAKNIEFQGDNKFIVIFKLRDPESVLDAGTYTEDNLKNDTSKLLALFPEHHSYIINLYENSKTKAIKPHPMSRLFYMTIILSNGITKKQSNRINFIYLLKLAQNFTKNIIDWSEFSKDPQIQ